MKKQNEDLFFKDESLFEEVLTTHPELCSELLEMITDEKVGHIDLFEFQFVSDATFQKIKKGFHVKDEHDTIYNLAILQKEPEDIEELARLSHSLIDLEMMNRGRAFDELPKNFVIFFCAFDPIKAQKAIYSQQSFYNGNTSWPLNERNRTIFFNLACELKNVPENLLPLFQYIKYGIIGNDFIKKFDDAAKNISERRW